MISPAPARLANALTLTLTSNPPFPTHQMWGSLPAADWQIDFTHMPLVRRIRCLLVIVDTFSGWVETFPTSNERAQTVAQILLTEIILRFGLPLSLQSNNGPEFTSKITQQIIQFLQIPWKFHIPYHPQASGEGTDEQDTQRNPYQINPWNPPGLDQTPTYCSS